ncbi:hypothetical protein VULLAG_LOCUS5664 [Vulpes lagopus]
MALRIARFYLTVRVQACVGVTAGAKVGEGKWQRERKKQAPPSAVPPQDPGIMTRAKDMVAFVMKKHLNTHLLGKNGGGTWKKACLIGYHETCGVENKHVCIVISYQFQAWRPEPRTTSSYSLVTEDFSVEATEKLHLCCPNVLSGSPFSVLATSSFIIVLLNWLSDIEF